jgi:hypothetical protein
MSLETYIIKSNRSISELRDAIRGCAVNIKHLNVHYISHSDRVSDHNLTLLVCGKLNVAKLYKEYPEYKDKVDAFNWDNFKQPHDMSGRNSNLHIFNFQSGVSYNRVKNIILSAIEKIVGPECYELNIRRDRETDKIYGYADLVWTDKATDEQINICKLILHNKRINDGENLKDFYHIKCIWNNVRRDKKKKPVRDMDDEDKTNQDESISDKTKKRRKRIVKRKMTDEDAVQKTLMTIASLDVFSKTYASVVKEDSQETDTSIQEIDAEQQLINTVISTESVLEQ